MLDGQSLRPLLFDDRLRLSIAASLLSFISSLRSSPCTFHHSSGTDLPLTTADGSPLDWSPCECWNWNCRSHGRIFRVCRVDGRMMCLLDTQRRSWLLRGVDETTIPNRQLLPSRLLATLILKRGMLYGLLRMIHLITAGGMSTRQDYQKHRVRRRRPAFPIPNDSLPQNDGTSPAIA